MKRLLLIGLAGVYLSPIMLLLAGSFKADATVLPEMASWRGLLPASPSLQNYRDVLQRVDFFRFLLNSLLISGCITVCGLVLNALAGYSLARLRWRGRQLTLALVLALQILPFEGLAVPLFYQLTWLGWRDSYHVQILPFLANAMGIYLFYAFFVGMSAELEEAAYLDGADAWQAFRYVIAPNAQPVCATVALLTFLSSWGQYLWPLLMTTEERVRPLPLAMASFYTLPPLQWGDICAFGVLTALPVLALFFALQARIAEALASGGNQG